MKKVFIVIICLLFISCAYLFFNKQKMEPIDDSIDIDVSVLDDKVYIDSDNNYDLSSNISIKSNKDITVSCNPKELIEGQNNVKCIIKYKEKDLREVEYVLVKSTTYNKNVIFFGDSITAGFGSKSKKYSWATYIKNNYDLNDVVNAGISDYRLSTYDDSNKWLSTQVTNHYNDSSDYDFVILQGGINDIFYNTPLGVISSGFDLSNMDKNTFLGGLETYLYYVTNKWPTARIGYIMTYYTPRYSERGITWSYDDYKKYYDKTKEVLNKWNIKYLDLFDEKYSDILLVNDRKYLSDYLHLNDEGYDVISPYIYEFMKTLDKYKSN